MGIEETRRTLDRESERNKAGPEEWERRRGTCTPLPTCCSRRTDRTCLTGLFLAFACLGAPCLAQPRNMIGRQSQNEGMLVLPAPGKVTLDGDLTDWDFSGRIWVFADKDVRQRYSVEVAAMRDDSALYLAAKWKDPTPMYNTIDPDFNVEDGWKSDSWQMRVHTDRTCWITTWYFTPKQMPVMHIACWKNEADERAGQEVKVYRAKEGGTDLGGGIEMAYRKDADGKGFMQEIRIPRPVLYRQVPRIAPGLTFRMGLEFLWGDLVPVPEDNLLLCLSFKNYADQTTGMLGIDARTGAVRWS